MKETLQIPLFESRLCARVRTHVRLRAVLLACTTLCLQVINKNPIPTHQHFNCFWISNQPHTEKSSKNIECWNPTNHIEWWNPTNREKCDKCTLLTAAA